MLKKFTYGLIVCCCASIMTVSCGNSAQILADSKIPAVIVTRADGLTSKIEVYVDGEKAGSIGKGGKFGKRLMNGRHTVSVENDGTRSRVLDFYIQNNRQNFSVTAFENSGPTIRAF